jgi:hypothetical protein
MATPWTHCFPPAIAFLIGTSQRAALPTGIFVIRDGRAIVAKPIEHVAHSDPTKIVIKSLNPNYQICKRDGEEVNIVGPVVSAANDCEAP